MEARSAVLGACVSYLSGSAGCEAAIREAFLSPKRGIHYGIEVDATALVGADPELGALTLRAPREMVGVFDEAVREVMRRMYAAGVREGEGDGEGEGEGEGEAASRRGCVKNFVHTRLRAVPAVASLWRETLSCIRAGDAGRFFCIGGTVTRVGKMKIVEHEKLMECRRCGFRFPVRVSSTREEENGTMCSDAWGSHEVVPEVCPRPRGARAEAEAEEGEGEAWVREDGEGGCGGREFRAVEGVTLCRDYQEIRVQEHMGRLGMGRLPRSMTVCLEDDLADRCKAGDDVLVTGWLEARWGKLKEQVRCDLGLCFRANHVLSLNVAQRGAALRVGTEDRREFTHFWSAFGAEPLRGRNHVLRSVCPQLYGLYTVKLALLLCLVGGVGRTGQGGTKVRGESHLLMVGDPGMGKSQLLKYAAKLSPRCVMTTGIGSTAAGLTAAAVQRGGDWVLEAGALVLADGGVCCIDEFNSIRSADRTTIHEAMEQQTVSVAKAGLMSTLPTRATVIAACNPRLRGGFDPHAELTANVGIEGPLLSRFDVILVLQDVKDPGWDATVASHILQERGGNAFAGKDGSPGRGGKRKRQRRDSRGESGSGEAAYPVWTLDTLKKYVHHVRHTFHPTLDADAEEVITRQFQRQRQRDARSASRTTVRMLESLVRVTQAHARLMYRSVATVQDAVTAILVIENALQPGQGLREQGPGNFGCGFCEDPTEQYEAAEERLLRRLGLCRDPHTGALAEVDDTCL